MALAADACCTTTKPLPMGEPIVVPASIQADWKDVLLAGGVNAADNAGGEVLLPAGPGGITKATLALLLLAGRGTTVQVRLKYNGTVTTAPVIQLFGLDSAGVPERLYNNGNTSPGNAPGGTPTHDLTFAIATATDVTWNDGVTTWSFTDSQECDCNGACRVLVAVKTAIAGTAAATSTIQLRVK